MESLLPQLFFLSFFAPLVLRLGAAIAFFFHAKNTWGPSFREKALALKEALFGLLILVGFLTQLVALAGILVVLGRGVWLKSSAKDTWTEKILLVVILLSLAVTGAGAFAIDLPY